MSFIFATTMKNKQVPVILLALLAYILHEVFLRLEETQVIQISSGQLKGFVSKSREGRSFFKFLGIPFAKPPLGDLRFEPPQEAEKWEGIFYATNYGAKCPQLSHVFQLPDGEEDCLLLDVYTPQLPSAEKNLSLPVMVFFHGGIYAMGSGILYGGDYLTDEGVILVVPHYRLSSFGFLNTGDGVVPGNMGLKDQVMALKWVQENIKHFGGDSNQVTIFGQSAGAASVHFHVLSPMSKGLFHRAISQSGTALSPWTLKSNPKAQADWLAQKLHCPTNDTKAMVICLKRASMEEILYAHREVMDYLVDPDIMHRDLTCVFVPTVESGNITADTFLPAHPRDMLEAGHFNKVPWMSGINAQDGLMLSLASIRTQKAYNLLYNNVEVVLPPLLFMHSNENVTMLKDYYMTKHQDIRDEKTFNKFTDMFTDRLFLNGVRDAAKLQAPLAPVYLYVYSYKGEFRMNNGIAELKSRYFRVDAVWFGLKFIWNQFILGLEAPFYGVGHFDEVVMVLTFPYVAYVGKNHRDYEISKSMVKLWAAFARNRKTLQFRNITWNPIDPLAENLKYLNLSLTPSLFDDPFTERYELWNSINASPNL